MILFPHPPKPWISQRSVESWEITISLISLSSAVALAVYNLLCNEKDILTTVVVSFCECALGQGMSLPWRTPSWILLPASRMRFLSALLGPRHSQWVTPSSPQSGRQPGWLCMRRWWSKWRTTRRHQRCGQTGTWRPMGRGVRSTDINYRGFREGLRASLSPVSRAVKPYCTLLLCQQDMRTQTSERFSFVFCSLSWIRTCGVAVLHGW